jgi:hypothetical protein
MASKKKEPLARRPRKAASEAKVVYTTDQTETEERLVMNKPLYAAPGTSQPKRHRPRVRARQAKVEGTSLRGERRKQEEVAENGHKMPNRTSTKWHAMSAAEQLAMLDAAAAEAEAAKARKIAAGTHKEAMWIDPGRPGVWQLGSWVEGDPRCPDERPTWMGG